MTLGSGDQSWVESRKTITNSDEPIGSSIGSLLRYADYTGVVSRTRRQTCDLCYLWTIPSDKLAVETDFGNPTPEHKKEAFQKLQRFNTTHGFHHSALNGEN